MSAGAGQVSGPLSRIVRDSHLKYLGLTLVLAWHYCLWFVPSAFPTTFLLDDRITFSWLIALAAAGVVPLALAGWLGRNRHLEARPSLVWPVSVMGSVATMTLSSAGMLAAAPWVAYAAAFVVGSCAGVLWVLWGERLACQKARFTLSRVAPTYGGFLLALVGITFVAPGWLAPAVVAALPLLSGLLLWAHTREFSHCPPRLLPLKASTQGNHTMVTVTVISFVAAYVCYYTVAIVPWDALAVVQDSFTLGIVIGAALILLFAVLQKVVRNPRSTFRVYPWLLLLIVIACVLFLADDRLDAAAFLLAVAISSMFEILLTMYMGVLTQRGYAPPAAAFALSGSAIRLGICAGNGTALVYERVPGWHDVLVRPTFVVLVAVVAGLLITMVRQEYAIEELTRSPQAESELAAIVNSVAEEFRLSEREREIMALVSQGYTASVVAEKLVISPYTVNTHIQHIYGKLGIHKRSELIGYLRRST
ncbi:MAG: helix-turn-helix transcriptional regulator [Propionibacteriaceae bacterium]|nr:helix-turn-helix transcriptional regulator [Propionibacteriaceae bacterium]